MAWEQRGKRRYYYRGRLVQGRIVKEYLGCGPKAEEAAREDAERRARSRAAREARQRADRPYATAMTTLRALGCEMADLLRVILLIAGFHEPKYGVWRLPRVPVK